MADENFDHHDEVQKYLIAKFFHIVFVLGALLTLFSQLRPDNDCHNGSDHLDCFQLSC